jgi:excisionase family DNA binding protein
LKAKKDWVLTAEAAEIIGCSDSTVLRLADDGELKSWRFREGGWRHITRKSLDRYLEKSRNGGKKK